MTKKSELNLPEEEEKKQENVCTTESDFWRDAKYIEDKTVSER